MKNKLAENMLRFGVKNLQESDIKKIEEAKLDEIMLSGIDWKYPFTDQAQLESYMNLMRFNRAVIQSGLAMNPYNDGETLNGLAVIHQALVRATAMQGIMPGTLPSEKVAGIVAESDILTSDQKRVSSNALKTPFFSRWYTKYWVPTWKNGYIKTFGQLPTATPNPQAPNTTPLAPIKRN